MAKLKHFDLKELPKGVAISFHESWMDGIFDSIESAQYFIDNAKYFLPTMYDSIDKMKRKAIAINEGYITIDIIKEIAEL